MSPTSSNAHEFWSSGDSRERKLFSSSHFPICAFLPHFRGSNSWSDFKKLWVEGRYARKTEPQQYMPIIMGRGSVLPDPVLLVNFPWGESRSTRGNRWPSAECWLTYSFHIRSGSMSRWEDPTKNLTRVLHAWGQPLRHFRDQVRLCTPPPPQGSKSFWTIIASVATYHEL